MLQSSAALSPDGLITPEFLPDLVSSPASAHESPRSQSTVPGTAAAPLSEAQQSHKHELAELLKATGGNVSEVARRMGKARSQVQRWLRRYAVDPADYKP